LRPLRPLRLRLASEQLALATGFAGAAGQGQGGAIFSRSGPSATQSATVLLDDVTIAGNTASASGGLLLLADGSISHAPVVLVMYNTIVAGSTGGTNDIDTATVNGGSLSFVGSNDLIQTNPASDGFPVSPTIITGEDPLLGPLFDNGGPIPTMALLPGSPALGAGSSTYVNARPSGGRATDQRGLPRIVNGGGDLGAYELNPVSTAATVSDQTLEGGTPDGVGAIAPLTTGGRATDDDTAAPGRTHSMAVPLAGRLHAVDRALESDFGARRPLAIPTGPTIRTRHWRAKIAGDGRVRGQDQGKFFWEK
jgi:hypothetical protein